MKIGGALKTIGINLVLILAILLAFESYLYYKSPQRKLPRNGWFDGRQYTWGHLVINNDYGFRERNFAKRKAPGVKRIMVLGDSLTWGAGLSPEQRYTGLLEALLNDRKGPAPRYEVINFGVQGGPTTAERDILKKHVDDVDPDLIVVGFCVNDPQPRGEDYSREKELFDRKYRKSIDLLTGVLRKAGFRHAAEALQTAVYRLAEKFGAIPPWGVGLGRVYEKDSPEWKSFEQALRDIKEISDRRRLPTPIFAILNSGSSPRTLEDYRNPPNETVRNLVQWFHQVEETGKRVGFRTYDHQMEIIEDLQGQDLNVTALDAHPSAALNGTYAKKLHKVITSEYENR